MADDAASGIDLLGAHGQAVKHFVCASLSQALQWKKHPDIDDWERSGRCDRRWLRGGSRLRCGGFFATDKQQQRCTQQGYGETVHSLSYKNNQARSATLSFTGIANLVAGDKGS